MSFSSVRYSDFTNTLNSIAAINTEALIVNNCNFTNERSLGLDLIFTGFSCGNGYYPTSTIVDIFTNQAGGIRIVNNTFQFDDKNVHHIDIAHSDVNSNFKSFVKANTFTNTFSSGTAVSADDVKAVVLNESCENLNVTCNTFHNFGNDIFIGSSGEVLDFANDGAGNDLASMNEFSDIPLLNRIQVNNTSTVMSSLPKCFWKAIVSEAPIDNNGFVIPILPTNNEANCDVLCTETAIELHDPTPCIITTYTKSFESNILKIYPNLAHTKLFINLQFSAADMNYSVQMISLGGKLVKEILIKDLGNNNFIDLQGLKTGLYLVKVVTAKYAISGRVLIE